jgi:hypothetical protein
MMIKLPEKPKRRANENRDLVKPIEDALNGIPGVRVARNSIGLVLSWHRRHDPSATPFWSGLGPGSADLVGIVKMHVLFVGHQSWATDGQIVRISDSVFTRWEVGRVFCLEAKRSAEEERKSRSAKRRITIEDQERWARAVRSLGGFCAVVHSVEEAIDAVSRCRSGCHE